HYPGRLKSFDLFHHVQNIKGPLIPPFDVRKLRSDRETSSSPGFRILTMRALEGFDYVIGSSKGIESKAPSKS
ncbi:7328_t:CDS:2, partial [Acaulospora colombiana]